MIWIAALMLGGFALAVAEIFLPGILVGLVGVALLLAAVVVAGFQFGPVGLGWTLGIELAVGTLIFFLWMRYFPQSRFGSKFRLDTTESQKSGDSLPADWIGAEGVALTALRPSGTAKIRDRRLDVLTEGLHVEAGKTVTIVKIEGAAIFVRPTLIN
ncbi:MAG: NfeD family protein [Candidatus Methylacidiphilales bacterium]|nr:NfeD family protein [Candidatus Methylacidiphilales bacterium]